MNYVTKATVINIIDHALDVKEYILKLENVRKYSPGSFVQLTLDSATASEVWPDSRTFSIASYEKGQMKFIIKNVGDYTNRIFTELTIGKECTIKYPFGDLFDKGLLWEKHLLIAGGVGISPYIGIIDYFSEHNTLNNLYLFYSAKQFKNLLYYDKLNKLLCDNMEIFITQEDNDKAHNRRIDIDDIKRLADMDTNIYVCGSKSFNEYYKKLLNKNGYKKIRMDEWE